MARYVRRREEPVVYDEPVDEPVPDTGTSWTAFALIKYGFILIMTIIILYFIAAYILPLIR
jgi:hypothetical protein